MNAIQAIWTALQFILLIIQAFKAEMHRGEGREQVRQAEQKAHEAAVEAAQEIDRSAADADLDELRERMRHYQRDRDAL